MREIASEDFYDMLIEDLAVEAEKAGMKPLTWKNKSTVKTFRVNQLESKAPFQCPCGHFCAHSYVVGQKPKRCPKCHRRFDQ